MKGDKSSVWSDGTYAYKIPVDNMGYGNIEKEFEFYEALGDTKITLKDVEIVEFKDSTKGLRMELLDRDLYTEYEHPTESHTARKFITDICDLYKLIMIMHKKKIIHCDIKPENIGISKENNRLVLFDFEYAMRYNETTVLSGTETYIPPSYFKYPRKSRNYSRYFRDMYAYIVTIAFMLNIDVTQNIMLSDSKSLNCIKYRILRACKIKYPDVDFECFHAFIRSVCDPHPLMWTEIVCRATRERIQKAMDKLLHSV